MVIWIDMMRNTCLVGNCFIERLDERQSEATETGVSAGATANCSSEAPWWADLTPNMKFSFQLKLLAACSRQAWGTRSWPLRWDTPSIPVMKLPRWHIQPPPALIFHFSHTPLSTTHPPLFNSPLTTKWIQRFKWTQMTTSPKLVVRGVHTGSSS